MYDPIGDFFTHGATVYGRRGPHPSATVREQPAWHEPPPAPAGPWPPAPVGAWPPVPVGVWPADPVGVWPADPTAETTGTWTPVDVFEDAYTDHAGPFADPPTRVQGDAPPVPRHRRRPGRVARPWKQILASAVGALSAVTVAGVCLLGWVFSYNPLHDLACSRMPRGLSALWPLVIYGPWFVSCLSAVLAALDGRPLRHSWIVMTVFSSGAAALCIAATSHTALNMLVAGLPPITALVSLHQLVRQLDRSDRGERRGAPAIAVHRRAK